MVIYDKPLLHISESKDLKLLIPRLPSYLNKLEAQDANFEDLNIYRNCFAPTIEGCLLAVNISSSKFKNKDYLDYFVYEAMYVRSDSVITNEEIIQRELVYDAKITNEVWVTAPTSVKLKYAIKIFPYDDDSKEIEYTPLRLKIMNKKIP